MLFIEIFQVNSREAKIFNLKGNNSKEKMATNWEWIH